MLLASLRPVAALRLSGIRTLSLTRLVCTMAPVDTTWRLTRLRTRMADHQLAAYLIPSEDAHQSEYIAEIDKRREYISGFSGSFGAAVVTLDNRAALWTDGRYFLQAAQELDANWTLMRFGVAETPLREDWLNKVLPERSRVGVDPQLLSISAARTLSKALSARGHSLVPIAHNLVDQVWSEEVARPARPCAPIRILDAHYTGTSVADKLARLRKEMAARSTPTSKVAGTFVTALDDVAWLFNLRGEDIPFNPVFFAYAYVDRERAVLYTNNAQMMTSSEGALAAHLGPHVEVRAYEAVWPDASAVLEVLRAPQPDPSVKCVVLLGRNCSWAFGEIFGEQFYEETLSLVTSAKAIKNESELEWMRRVHVKDAVALCHFFSWIESTLAASSSSSLSSLDELACAAKVDALRGEQEGFVGLSFETISASGPNGAVVHYRPTAETNRHVTKDDLYLCDSGAQYVGGTTDVTRTMHFGTPTDRQRECFTRVLQGHIALDATVFPTGTTGFQIDAIARRPLWLAGLDYRHGTGHGVGAFLNVHEGPHGIGTRPALNEVALAAGMTVTNEPGYYEDQQFGIRIENVLIVKKADHLAPSASGVQYLAFEPITLVPIQTKMIDPSMLTKAEVTWINAYHQRCRDVVGPELPAGSPAHAWLLRETAPIIA